MPNLQMNNQFDNDEETKDTLLDTINPCSFGHSNDSHKDLTFYEDQNDIQQQYRVYAYEYNKNYKSWGANKNGEMMTNKEYLLIWEWFRDTLKGVAIEEGVVLKTLAYYCVVNEVFQDTTEAFDYFNHMTLSHENLVLSFAELITVVTNPSFDQSIKLRNHIKNKQHRSRKKKSDSTTALNNRPPTHLPSLKHNRRSSVVGNSKRRQSVSVSTSSSLPALAIPSSSNKQNSKRKASGVAHHQSDLQSNHRADHQVDHRDHHHSGQTSSTQSAVTRRSTQRNTVSSVLSAAVSSQLNATPNVHLVGRLSSIGRAFRRQLSRLASRDDIGQQDAAPTTTTDTPSTSPSTTITSTGETVTEKKHKDKKQKPKKKKKKAMKEEECKDSTGDHSESDTTAVDTSTTEKAEDTSKGGVLTSIGRSFRRQLSRLSSFSEPKQRESSA